MFVNRSPRTPKSGAAAPAIVADVVRQSGTPLDAPTRAFMESRFNQSFGAVRIHADDAAQRSATALNASAYTVGNHVVLGAERWRSTTAERQGLLAHELAHTLQQSSGNAMTGSDLTVASADDAAEREAERVASRLVAGSSLPNPGRTAANRVYRALLPDVEDTRRKKDAISRSYVTTAPIPKADVVPQLGLEGAHTSSNAVNPPPAAIPAPSIEGAFRQGPPAKSIFDDDFLTKAPPKSPNAPGPKPDTAAPKEPERKTDAGTTLPPAPKPTPDAEASKDGPGGALQLGAGGQVTPSADTPGLGYVQVTLMLRDSYLIEAKQLPSWIKELKFLGEPSAQLQYHVVGAAANTLDAQVMFNLVQASFEVFKRKLDASVVAGAMASDITNLKMRTAGRAVAPVAGLDVEYELVKISAHVKLNLDVQGLVPYQWLPNPNSPGQRKMVGQSSGEVRLVVEF